jgi:hypothetical protein
LFSHALYDLREQWRVGIFSALYCSTSVLTVCVVLVLTCASGLTAFHAAALVGNSRLVPMV